MKRKFKKMRSAVCGILALAVAASYTCAAGAAEGTEAGKQSAAGYLFPHRRHGGRASFPLSGQPEKSGKAETASQSPGQRYD